MADERDPKVSRSYRELGAEEPPRALDEAILAASRRAVDVHPAPLVVPTGRRRWYFPVAAAAIITLAVAVTVQVERQKPDEELVVATQEPKKQTFQAPVEQTKPAPKPFVAEPPPAAAPPQSAEAPTELTKSNTEARARSDTARDSVAAVPAPAPAPEPARREMESPRPQASASSGARVMGQVQSKVETPEAWLERIATLRKEGKHEEADKALAEFRKRYPDYRLTDEMRAKVEKK
jgi:hypothetical protein